ncbi:Hsp70 family protein [Arthrobacter sp. M2012083]|uniref:Hsp70 family protein n=1 Tax=Arthrobacter sp. M2012083 TaxID=1197706 RepID=UPI0002D8D6C3|nr:Hsp70 family protein [Arthrobacter sp. M2012083]
MSYVLAIDVGTSFTAAALVKPNQGPTPTAEILPLGVHGSAVPSVLFYAEDGRILIGEAAERRGLDDPQRVVREFKRRIGDSVPLAVGESWLAPEDVYAAMARWVVDRAQEREGSSPSSIIMTHPAAWGQHRTSLVLAALNMVGLEDITLISEPEAAALHYASQTRVEDGSIIAVYDLGGGTFDTAVLRKASAGNFELLGRPDGIETLGGADFDAAVLRHVMGHLGEGVALDVSSPETLAALSRLRRECREAKEALSLDSEASVAVSLPGTQLSVRLVRSEFEAMIEAPVRDTVDALERSLRSINLEAQDLSAVLLIGGSSRIPLVAELISVELDRPIAVDADPKSSICLGAAVAGLRPSGAGSVDAEAAATAASAAANLSLESIAREKSADSSLGRPHAPSRAPFSHHQASTVKPGRHAPRPRVRMAAAAAAAATALTIATATAAQSPEGTGLLATVFGNQAADVMRDGGAQASGAQASGAGGAAGSSPVIGGPAAGLEASVKAGVTRAGSNGRAPARLNTTNPGATNAGKGSAADGSGNTAGTGAAGTSSGTAAGGTGGTTTPAAPGTGTSTPGTQAPTPPTADPDPTGGAAAGPTPPPAATTPPPVTTDPTTPPVGEPTTPPSTPTDPVTPPPPPPSPEPEPEPEPTVPQPEPTVVQDPPASPAPVLPQETTPPAVPDPLPTETSPTSDPALLSAV